MCVWQAKQLATHISELETTATKSGHELETTKAENLRLGDELKVATQQLDMMREVTRQLYAKITEQTDGFSRLAEAKSTAEMGKHQLQQQQSDTRQKFAPGSPTFLFGADSHSEQRCVGQVEAGDGRASGGGGEALLPHGRAHPDDRPGPPSIAQL